MSSENNPQEHFEQSPKQKQTTDPLKKLVEQYKLRIAETGLANEIYKWKLLEQYSGRPDTSVPDFLAELKSLDFKNLIYHMARGVLLHIATENSEGLKKVFIDLFDESKGLQERIKDFRSETLRLYQAMGQKEGHHQDERTTATYLSFKYPNKYTFYKASYYEKFCKLQGIKKAKASEKYTHYLDLLDHFIANYIASDQALIEQVKELLSPYYDGTNHRLLAQDILYQMLDTNTQTNYWLFQGNPKVFDFEAALRQNKLSDWTVSAHKSRIKVGDKVILWISGDKAGCYALAEVLSEPYHKQSDENNSFWKTEATSDLKVDLKIICNLVDRPILKEEISLNKALNKLNTGHQGTNFSATKKEYETILSITQTTNGQKYWLYAPGENASSWDEFYEEGIMGLGWDELGDLNKLGDKEDIVNAIQKTYDTKSKSYNNALANLEFRDTISVGDIIIPKKGRQNYLGYGIVRSAYYFDEAKNEYKHCRKVEWKKKGTWSIAGEKIVLKTLTDITKYPDYVQQLISLIGIEQESKHDKSNNSQMKFPLNTILYGPPGTGKTYNTILRAAEIVENRSITDYQEALQIFKKQLHQQIEFITFHQNYSYEDFIQGLRPDTENNSELTFEKNDGVFKKLADKALRNLRASMNPQLFKRNFREVFSRFIQPITEGEIEEIEVKMKKVSYFINGLSDKSIEFRKNSGDSVHTLSIATLEKMYEEESTLEIQGLAPYYNPLLRQLLKIGKDSNEKKEIIARKNFVIIIDEINRANISRVFGELITLIEPDKRSHGKLPMEVLLPSGDKFMVPSNLYIIGTMNTADKSIALLDIALRRRFEFEAMYPKYDLTGINDLEILKKINEYIINSKGHDFQIGHAYFMGDDYQLVSNMNKKVIPLLLEYYMSDEKEVKKILNKAGLKIEDGTWPITISGRND